MGMEIIHAPLTTHQPPGEGGVVGGWWVMEALEGLIGPGFPVFYRGRRQRQGAAQASDLERLGVADAGAWLQFTPNRSDYAA